MEPKETNRSIGGSIPIVWDIGNPSIRILVVEDDLHIRAFIVSFLTKASFRVDSAGDGAEAWEVLNVASYHLLITDHQMPKLTGLELIKKLRSESMDLPVILVSGTIPQEEISRHPELGIVATLPKPFEASELLDLVQKALNPLKRQPITDLSAKSPTASPSEEIPQLPQPTPAPIARIKASRRILVVDDDPDLRQLSVDVLAAANYHVEGAKDGSEGWDALQANNNFDLIITDNHMPKMTGVELIEKLRSARLKPRVIMATGNLPTEIFARRPWLTPDATLQRPYTNDDLLETVRRVLCTDDPSKEEKCS